MENVWCCSATLNLLLDKYNVLKVRRLQKGAKVKEAHLVNAKRFKWDSQLLNSLLLQMGFISRLNGKQMF